MIELNGRKYARDAAEMEATKTFGMRTCHGFYKVKRRKGTVAVLILDGLQQPIALVSPDACLVTAHNALGRTRYMYAMTRSTREFLGLPATTTAREEHDMAQGVLDQVRPCQSFLLCRNTATTSYSHPVLGTVLSCERCAAKLGYTTTPEVPA
jgi:hypothetical protein